MFLNGLKAIWQDLYNAGVQIVLNGHDHDYERFSRLDVNGSLDTAHGIREFVVGTGGREPSGRLARPRHGHRCATTRLSACSSCGSRPAATPGSSYLVAGLSFTDSGSEPCRTW